MIPGWLLMAAGALTIFALGWFTGRGTAAGRVLSGRPSSVHVFAGIGPAVRAEIEAAIADGHKIEAIKLLRDATGMGLKESRDAVEAMEAAMRPQGSTAPG